MTSHREHHTTMTSLTKSEITLRDSSLLTPDLQAESASKMPSKYGYDLVGPGINFKGAKRHWNDRES